MKALFLGLYPFQVLRDVYNSKATTIVLDCSKDIMGEVLDQAQQVGMTSAEYNYLLTGLDAHTVNLNRFRYGGTNFTTFRMININSPEVQAVTYNFISSGYNQMNQQMSQFSNGNLDTDSALIYDAVTLFAIALHELNRIQDISITGADCDGKKTWMHGNSLVNYMKLTEFLVRLIQLYLLISLHCVILHIF